MALIIMTTNGTVLNKDLTPKVDYSKMTLSELAAETRRDWSKQKGGVHPYAKDWLYALSTLQTIKDNYIAESGSMVVAYFLSNAKPWTGPIAREIKKELNKRLKGK